MKLASRIAMVVLSLGFLVSACDVADIGRPIEISGETSTADYVYQLAIEATQNAATATAYVATQDILVLTGTIAPSVTATPCVRDQYTGLCLPQEIAELLLTPTPVFNMPDSILRVRVNRSIEFANEPGQGYSASTLGKIMAGNILDIHQSVSGRPEASTPNPEKNPCKDNYYGLYLEGWMEREIDLNEEQGITTGIEHAWEHPKETHAHLFDNQGRLIAQIFPYPGMHIIKVVGESADGKLLHVILQIAWIEATGVRAEGCY